MANHEHSNDVQDNSGEVHFSVTTSTTATLRSKPKTNEIFVYFCFGKYPPNIKYDKEHLPSFVLR